MTRALHSAVVLIVTPRKASILPAVSSGETQIVVGLTSMRFASSHRIEVTLTPVLAETPFGPIS